ncbi:3755_t:CDS:2 [Paraglomus brasilianum]|uniref:3755_t:CDS:1 n=1 Tax=Paraglomus brasilianum TaxID=144538 RepID=A0A9N9GND9_9GLOM|nr:3755_t:CDS:2 [Paraglomus brasilianum]
MSRLYTTYYPYKGDDVINRSGNIETIVIGTMILERLYQEPELQQLAQLSPPHTTVQLLPLKRRNCTINECCRAITYGTHMTLSWNVNISAT